MLTRLSKVSVLMFLLGVSACKSPPPVQSQRPEPAAWAMEKAQDLQQMLNSIITVSEVESYASDAIQYSPIDGEVSTVIAEPGELIGPGYPVITLLDMNDLWVTFNVKEDLLPKVKIGSILTAYVPGLAKTIQLKIDYMAAQAEYATWSATKTRGDFDIRTFEVKARPVKRIAGLRPGMTVTVNWDEIK